MKKFIVYTLQILAILSAMILFACVCYTAIVPDVSDVPEWLSKMNTINFFVEPVLCVIALVALGDVKKSEKKTKHEIGSATIRVNPDVSWVELVNKQDPKKQEDTPDAK